jgi:hypothetical protein
MLTHKLHLILLNMRVVILYYLRVAFMCCYTKILRLKFKIMLLFEKFNPQYILVVCVIIFLTKNS